MSLSDTLLAAQHIDITEQSDSQSFVAALKTINDGLSQGQSEEPWGFAWWLRLGSDDDSPALVVGVRGKVGTLSWWEGEQEWRPESGLNAEDADTYTTTDGHHFTQPSGTELAIDLVYQAVEELVATHERPACIAWRAEDDL